MHDGSMASLSPSVIRYSLMMMVDCLPVIRYRYSWMKLCAIGERRMQDRTWRAKRVGTGTIVTVTHTA